MHYHQFSCWMPIQVSGVKPKHLCCIDSVDYKTCVIYSQKIHDARVTPMVLNSSACL